MSPVPTDDRDANALRPPRIESHDTVPSTAALLERLRIDAGLRSLSSRIVNELLRLDGYHERGRTIDPPDTTWELPASGLADLQPTSLRMGLL
jgi:hypothetical protein